MKTALEWMETYDIPALSQRRGELKPIIQQIQQDALDQALLLVKSERIDPVENEQDVWHNKVVGYCRTAIMRARLNI